MVEDNKIENIYKSALLKISREARSTYAARLARAALMEVALLRADNNEEENK